MNNEKRAEVSRWIEDGFVPAGNTYIRDIETACLDYVEAILWAETADFEDSDKSIPLDEVYGPLDLSDEFWVRARRDIVKLIDVVSSDIWRLDPGMFGADAWLTRQHHGAGFWDGDWDRIAGDGVGEMLTDLTESVLPETYVYVARDEYGDDNLYFAPEIEHASHD